MNHIRIMICNCLPKYDENKKLITNQISINEFLFNKFKKYILTFISKEEFFKISFNKVEINILYENDLYICYNQFINNIIFNHNDDDSIIFCKTKREYLPYITIGKCKRYERTNGKTYKFRIFNDYCTTDIMTLEDVLIYCDVDVVRYNKSLIISSVSKRYALLKYIDDPNVMFSFDFVIYLKDAKVFI